ncbi:hypothetical protein BJX64DRAFT_294286 [Aspergillus heterothallicus]
MSDEIKPTDMHQLALAIGLSEKAEYATIVHHAKRIIAKTKQKIASSTYTTLTRPLWMIVCKIIQNTTSRDGAFAAQGRAERETALAQAHKRSIDTRIREFSNIRHGIIEAWKDCPTRRNVTSNETVDETWKRNIITGILARFCPHDMDKEKHILLVEDLTKVWLHARELWDRIYNKDTVTNFVLPTGVVVNEDVNAYPLVCIRTEHHERLGYCYLDAN